MRAFLTRILELRKHPSREMRLLWWVGLAVLIWLASGPGGAAPLLVGIWFTFNIGLVLTAVGWAAFHPRALFPALRTAGAGSFWVAAAGTIWIGSTVTVSLSERMPESVTPALRTGLVLFSPLMLGLLLLAAFGLAQVSAAIGTFVTRRLRSPEAAITGVSAGWVALVGVLLMDTLGDFVRLPELLRQVLGGSSPVVVALLTRKALQTGCTPAEMRKQGMEWLARRLILRWQVGERPLRLDLRGPALGLGASAVGVLLVVSLALLPVQAQVLAALLQLRNGFEAATGFVFEPKLQAQPVRATLLELDLEARRKAATTSSEAGVQAEMIRKLAGYGARIVLPLPVCEPLDRGETRMAIQSRAHVAALPAETDIRRSVADIDELVAACRTSGAVFLEIPAGSLMELDPSSEKVLARLKNVVAGVGRADLEAFGAPELPVLSMPELSGEPASAKPLVQRLTSLPLLLAAGKRGHAVIQGLPQIAPGKVLVSVRATQPEQSFPRVSYGSVLRGEPLLLPAAEAQNPAGRWVAPEAYFRDRTVFLDPLLPILRDTVAGRMPQAEVLAHALATLQTRSTTSRAPEWAFLLMLAAAGLVTGAACTGRDPFRATWIAGGIEVGALLFSTSLFLGPVLAGLLTGRGPSAFNSIWIDPVAPMVVVLVAYLLTANLTLAVERAQRERNKGLLERFVAPQVVNELLDEMENLGGDVALGGKRQQVCVIFADVRGFTRFAEAQPPEVVIEVTNQYLTALTEALHRHDGLLDKYLGDGLMAFFRVVDPAADVRKAVQAALAMRDAAATVSIWQAAQNRPVLQVGISMHYGEAVVGLVGNPAQFNYTALGHTVVVTQRLQSVAGAGEVILSETVYSVVEGEVAAETGTPVFVKGLSQPVCYYRIPNPADAAAPCEGVPV